MKKSVSFTVTSMTLATLALLGSTVASAETPVDNALCAAQSPLADSHSQQTVTAADEHALHDLYASLSGRWHGEVREVVCMGRGNTLRDQWRYFSVSEADATVLSDGTLRLRSHKERLDTRHGLPTQRVISVTPQSKTDYYPARLLLKADVVNSHHITTQVQYRQSNRLVSATSVTGASAKLTNVRTREDTLTLTGDNLSITTHWYTNGVYAGTEFTQLSRY